MISNEGLEEFKLIMSEDYGVTLTDEQAYQDFTAFLESFKVLAAGTSLIQKSSVDSQSKGYG